MTTPRPPRSLDAAGRRLWRAILLEFEMSPAEVALLELACQAADDAARARSELTNGITSTGRYGQVVLHPAVMVARQAEASVSRILGQLNVIDPIERPARRLSTPGPKPGRRLAS